MRFAIAVLNDWFSRGVLTSVQDDGAYEESNVLFEDRATTALPELCGRPPRPIPAESGHLPQLHGEMGSFE
jgi:hypothetical protein